MTKPFYFYHKDLSGQALAEWIRKAQEKHDVYYVPGFIIQNSKSQPTPDTSFAITITGGKNA